MKLSLSRPQREYLKALANGDIDGANRFMARRTIVSLIKAGLVEASQEAGNVLGHRLTEEGRKAVDRMR